MHDLKTPTVPTLSESLETYLSVRRLRPDTAKAYRQKIHLCLADWLNRPLSEITDSMVLDRHAKLSGSPVQADYVFRVLRALYRFSAIYYRLPGLQNPVPMLSACRQWNARSSRTRRFEYIDKHDLREWYDALDMVRPHMKDLLMFLVLTGLRLSEACNMRWDDVDLENGRFTLGWDKSRPLKNNQIHRLPLSDYLWDMLKRRKAQTRSPWVFTSRWSDAPLQSPYKAIKFISEQTGIQFRPHSLRRTFINLATIESVGASDDVRKALLNHVEGTKDHHYETMDEDRLRRVMQSITDEFFKYAGVRRRLYAKETDRCV